MRYPKGHKDETRRRILDVSSRRFRKHGLEAVGIADLMKAAGLTHGGFYFHFPTKKHLIREAVGDALDQSNRRNERVAREGLEALVRRYLSPAKRDKPDNACAAAALVAEIARQPVAVRRPFMENLDRFIDLIAAQLPDGDAPTRRRKAVGIFSVMMGALQIARAEPDPTRSQEILDSGIEAALRLGAPDS
jgi:TetR/AcrR family transcriptional repressor of nem operon